MRHFIFNAALKALYVLMRAFFNHWAQQILTIFPSSPQQIVGGVSPQQIYNPQQLRRIVEHCGNQKRVFLD
jgi:hypothetical protein